MQSPAEQNAKIVFIALLLVPIFVVVGFLAYGSSNMKKAEASAQVPKEKKSYARPSKSFKP